MSSDRRVTTMLGGSFTAMLLVQSALGQAVQQSTGQGSEPAQLEEIVVTAQKRSENIQNVPMSVTAVKGDTLQKLSLNNFTDIALLTPGLELIDTNGRNFTPTLRGVFYNQDAGSTPTVDTYWNEMVLPTPGPAFRTMFDTADVEVLRGPQGALRGRTSPGGAITINTHRPDMDEYDGYVQQELSDLGLVHSEGAVNVPIVSDTLALRVAGVYDFNYVNQGKDLTTGKDERSQTRALRESLRWTPTDDLEVNLTHQDLTNRNNFYQDLVGGPGISGGPVLTPSDAAILAISPINFMERQDMTVLNAKYDFADNLELDYIGGYGQYTDEIARNQDPTDTILNYLQFQNFVTQLSQLTQEVRVQSSGNDFWNYMFGVYYDFSRDSTSVIQSQALTGYTPGPPKPPSLTGDVFVRAGGTTRDFAFFTVHSFQITDSDLVQGAARWGQTNAYLGETLSIAIPRRHLVINEPPQIPALYAAPAEHYLTGMFNYTHHFDKDLMAYVAWSHSFRPGSFNAGASQANIDPSLLKYGNEKSDEFEIGTKDSFFDHRLKLDFDIFHQKFHGYIGYHPTVYWRPGSTGLATNTIPAAGFNGDADVNGAEFEADGLITPDWQLNFSAAVADARFDNALSPCNDYLGTGNPNNAPPGVTPRVTGNRQVSYCVLNNQIGGSPPWSLTLTTEYDHPIFDLQGFVRGLASYKAGYYYPNLQTSADPMLTVNLYLGLRDPDGHWEAQMFIKNLLDRVDQVYQSPTDFTTGNNLYDSGYKLIVQNPPREIGFTLQYNFGG